MSSLAKTCFAYVVLILEKRKKKAQNAQRPSEGRLREAALTGRCWSSSGSAWRRRGCYGSPPLPAGACLQPATRFLTYAQQFQQSESDVLSHTHPSRISTEPPRNGHTLLPGGGAASMPATYHLHTQALRTERGR